MTIARVNQKVLGAVEFKAIPEVASHISVATITQDARPGALKDFLLLYNSPLAPYAELMVITADEYGLDFRLLPAIAMQESNLCKRIPKDSYNCFGFGIYGSKVTRFENFEEAITTVARTLAKEYIAKGYRNPDEIMKKYTPASNGSWAESVAYYMDLIYTIL